MHMRITHANAHTFTMSYMFQHNIGGHVNCAVTLALVIAGACEPLDGLVIVLGQVCGSLLGAGFLAAVFNKSNDGTGALGSNSVTDGYGVGSAFVAEALLTFMLVFVVMENAVRKRMDFNPKIALNGMY